MNACFTVNTTELWLRERLGQRRQTESLSNPGVTGMNEMVHSVSVCVYLIFVTFVIFFWKIKSFCWYFCFLSYRRNYPSKSKIQFHLYIKDSASMLIFKIKVQIQNKITLNLNEKNLMEAKKMLQSQKSKPEFQNVIYKLSPKNPAKPENLWVFQQNFE